jgi:hypothetical protein
MLSHHRSCYSWSEWFWLFHFLSSFLFHSKKLLLANLIHCRSSRNLQTSLRNMSHKKSIVGLHSLWNGLEQRP